MRRRLRASVLGLTVVGLGGGVVAQGASPLAGDPARGRGVFVKKKCVECHAILGSGGTLGPDLAEVGKGRSYFELVARLWDHSPRMLASMEEQRIRWPTIDTAEMGDLIAYLYYLNYFDKPGDFRRGQKAFADKRCVRCHSVGGRGGDVAKPLDDYAAVASPLHMLAAMWNHGPEMFRKFHELGVDPVRFQGSEAADILAFLRASTVKPGLRTEYLVPGVPARGREVFVHKSCTTCHVAHAGDSDGEEKHDLSKVDLHRSVSELAGVLWNHGPMIWSKLADMDVAVSPFTTRQMTDLVAYLYSIGYYDTGGDVGRGARLFGERGCTHCHDQDAAAEIRGPVLSRMKSVKNPVSFASAFWNHAPGMLDSARVEVLPWPRLTEAEMRDIAAYLRQSGKKD